MKTRKRKRPAREPQPDAKAREDASLALEEFLDEPPKKKRATSPKKSIYELAVKSAKVRSKSGDWTGSNARVFVGLYAVCHRVVYGIEPEELKPDTEMKKAMRLARKCLKQYFDGDVEEMITFILWTWERQKGKENWALSQGRSINRLSPWFQFGGSLVTDYRKSLVDKKRTRKRGR